MNMGVGDTKELPKDEAALYAQVQALLHQQQQQAVAAQQIQVHHFTSLFTCRVMSLIALICACYFHLWRNFTREYVCSWPCISCDEALVQRHQRQQG